MIWIIFVIYVAMSVTGLLLIKTGTTDTRFLFSDGLLGAQVSYKLLLGLVFYICSFILSIYIMSRMKLSLFYPIGAGAVLVASCVFSYFVLREQIGVMQLAGITLILLGIICINIRI